MSVAEKEFGRYLSLMGMTDEQLRIYNANQRGVLERDHAYQRCEDFDILKKIEDRSLTGDEYLSALFPSFYKPTVPSNGNGRNGNDHRTYIPSGFAVSDGGLVVPVKDVPKANKAFRETIR